MDIEMKEPGRFMTAVVRRICFVAIGVCAVLASQCVATADEVSIQIKWGIRPTDIQQYNGTTFRKASGDEWPVGEFNAGYSMRLAFTGDGTFDENAGFSTLQWVGDPEVAEHSNVVFSGSEALTGDFTVYCTTPLPITWFGEVIVIDPDEEIYEGPDGTIYEDPDEYYTPLWHDAHFVSLVCETATRRVWRISEMPGGSDFATMSPVVEMVTASPSPLYPNCNRLNIIPSVDGKAVYFGAEIPQRCVWMADKGLTAEDLAGYDAKTVEMAMALDMLPAEVAGGVELAFGSISLSGSGTATLEWRFDAKDASGASQAVSSLRGGAILWLVTAPTLAGLDTDEAVRTALDVSDPSARSVSVSAAGTSLFAKLEFEP